MGPLARTVEDLELAMSLLTGPDLAGVPGGQLPPPSPAARSLDGLRVSVWVDDPAAPTTAEVKAAIRDLAGRLADEGAQVDETSRPGPSLEEMTGVYLQLLTGTKAVGFTPKVLARFQSLVDAAGPQTDSFELARARGAIQRHGDWLEADERRHRFMAAWARLFERVDVVLAPCAPGPAFPHDTERGFGQRLLDIDGEQVPYVRHIVWAGLATLPLLPATVVPVRRSASGLPIGVQIVGPRFGDRTTMAVGRLVEEVTGGFVPPPAR
jgi:amidase